jgi:hypothetical protein
MNPLERRLKVLEQKRIALNQGHRAQTLVEANGIERELWALRLAISRFRATERRTAGAGYCRSLAEGRGFS